MSILHNFIDPICKLDLNCLQRITIELRIQHPQKYYDYLKN